MSTLTAWLPEAPYHDLTLVGGSSQLGLAACLALASWVGSRRRGWLWAASTITRQQIDTVKTMTWHWRLVSTSCLIHDSIGYANIYMNWGDNPWIHIILYIYIWIHRWIHRWIHIHVFKYVWIHRRNDQMNSWCIWINFEIAISILGYLNSCWWIHIWGVWILICIHRLKFMNSDICTHSAKSWIQKSNFMVMNSWYESITKNLGEFNVLISWLGVWIIFHAKFMDKYIHEFHFMSSILI